MIVRPSSDASALSQQNHRQPFMVRALRWFWRFSQFYGEYTVRSPQAQQTWLAEQRAQK